MEVKANINIDTTPRVGVSPTRRQTVSAGTDSVSFQKVEALDQALQATPVARTEAVARARELIGDVKYPPADTINSIAALLALKMGLAPEADSTSKA
jgi:hypothetical protein